MKENFIIVLFADRDAAIPYDRDRDTNRKSRYDTLL